MSSLQKARKTLVPGWNEKAGLHEEETDTGSEDLKGPITIGMDLGDKTSRYYMLDANGETVREGSVGTTKAALMRLYGQLKRCRIALEVGTHSPWISRLLTG